MHLRLRLLALLVSLVFVSACHPHVQLPALPEKDAPLQERLEAYDELAPDSMSEVTRLYVSRGFGWATTETDFLMLRNGLRVHHPEDLLPAVAPDSPTASYIESYLGHRKREDIAGYIGIGAEVVLVGSLGFALNDTLQGSGKSAPPLYGVAIGAGVVTLGALIVSLVSKASAQTEKRSVFMSYDTSLQRRLDLKRTGAAPREETPAPVDAGDESITTARAN